MLDFCLNTFKKEYDEKGDALILDRYTLAPGIYILVDKDTGKVIESVTITKENCRDEEYLQKFAKLDYLSKVINTNKVIVNKKIHSNNYLSFFVKAENIIPNSKGSMELEISDIDNHYDVLANFKGNGKTKKMYELVTKEVNDIDVVSLNKCRDWIKNNITTLVDKYKVTKDVNYVKVFFQEDISVYERESKRYITPRIFNNNKYNKFTQDGVYGVPDNNFGLNTKKPYMMLKGKLVEEPMLVTLKEVELMKKFFDYLLCLVESQPKLTNVYISEDALMPIANEDVLTEDFDGVFMHITKALNEAEIVDFDIVERFNPKVKINVMDVISTFEDGENKNPIKYGEITTMAEVKDCIDSIFFNGYLKRNIFSSAQDIAALKIPRDVKRDIISMKSALVDWFYRGDILKVKTIFPKKSMDIIIENVSQGYTLKAAKQMNLRYAILNYLEGVEVNMKRKFENLHENIVDGLLNTNLILENDDEYYFFVGQVSYYLLSKSKFAKKNMNMIRIVESSNPDVMLKKFNMIYEKNRRSEFLNDGIVRHAISTVLDYEVEGSKVNLEALNCGYLYSNAIIMAKKERKELKTVKNGGNNNE